MPRPARHPAGPATSLANGQEDAMKKAYAAPTVTLHGGAVAATQGNFGRLLEFINFRFGIA